MKQRNSFKELKTLEGKGLDTWGKVSYVLPIEES